MPIMALYTDVEMWHLINQNATQLLTIQFTEFPFNVKDLPLNHYNDTIKHIHGLYLTEYSFYTGSLQVPVILRANMSKQHSILRL